MAVKKKPAPKSSSKASTGVPQIKYPGDVGFDSVDPSLMEDINFGGTDPQFNIDRVTPGTVTADELANRFMTAADYAMVDPAEFAREFGDINREQMRENANLSSDIALQQLETELRGLQNFVPGMAELKRSQTALDNTFNQAERDRQLAAVDPNIRADLMSQRERALAFASGRVPDAIQDRALELGIRSRAADMAGAGGFGTRSSAARKASELMSAEQRIQLSAMGDNLLTTNLANRNTMLFAPTAFSDAGAQLNVMPTKSGAELSSAALSDINKGTILDPNQALSAQIDQNQFTSKLEQEARSTNLEISSRRDIEQARLNLEAGSTNVANQLNADLSFQDARLRADISGAQIRSQEAQFNTQLRWNTANANTQRLQESNMFNSEMQFKAGTANRDSRIQVQQFNKNLIFQDQQARRAEAAANARAAMAEAGANSRAAMNANLQREQFALSIAEKERDRQFAIQQQQTAFEMYKQGFGRGETSSTAGAVGGALGRIPTVIQGVSGLITGIADAGKTIGGWFGSSDTGKLETPKVVGVKQV